MDKPKIKFRIENNEAFGFDESFLEGTAILQSRLCFNNELLRNLKTRKEMLHLLKSSLEADINEELYGEIRKGISQLHTLLRKLYRHFAPSSGDFYETTNQIEECLSNIGDYKIDFDLGEDNE